MDPGANCPGILLNGIRKQLTAHAICFPILTEHFWENRNRCAAGFFMRNAARGSDQFLRGRQREEGRQRGEGQLRQEKLQSNLFFCF